MGGCRRLPWGVHTERPTRKESKVQSHSQSPHQRPRMSTLPEMMLLPSRMKSMLWQVMLGTVMRSSSRLDSVCHTLMSFLAQVANSSAVPLRRSHRENEESSHTRYTLGSQMERARIRGRMLAGHPDLRAPRAHRTLV